MLSKGCLNQKNITETERKTKGFSRCINHRAIRKIDTHFIPRLIVQSGKPRAEALEDRSSNRDMALSGISLLIESHLQLCWVSKSLPL